MCDVDARQAVERLYAAKDMAPTKQLSIMCRSFADVAEYTLGFPAPQPGRPDAFRLARQALPGPVRRHGPPYPQSTPYVVRANGTYAQYGHQHSSCLKRCVRMFICR